VTRLGSWAHTIFQWLALVTAWPIVCFVGVTLWISLQTYGFQRLRLNLLRDVRNDLLSFARFPAALLPRERDVVQQALDEIDGDIGKSTDRVAERDERRAYEVTSLLFTRSGQELDTAEIEARASEISRRARVCLAQRLNTAARIHVARRWLIWITLEEAKALIAACRHVGLARGALGSPSWRPCHALGRSRPVCEPPHLGPRLTESRGFRQFHRVRYRRRRLRWSRADSAGHCERLTRPSLARRVESDHRHACLMRRARLRDADPPL
jgi:hypothetical protein